MGVTCSVGRLEGRPKPGFETAAINYTPRSVSYLKAAGLDNLLAIDSVILLQNHLPFGDIR